GNPRPTFAIVALLHMKTWRLVQKIRGIQNQNRSEKRLDQQESRYPEPNESRPLPFQEMSRQWKEKEERRRHSPLPVKAVPRNDAPEREEQRKDQERSLWRLVFHRDHSATGSAAAFVSVPTRPNISGTPS